MTDTGQDQLDIDRILGKTFVARVEYHPTIGSTNDRAKLLAAEGPGELPLLIVAGRQTAGRGRGANLWWTGSGSLAMTLLLGPDESAAGRFGRSPLIGLAAAVAIVETVRPLLPSEQLGIGWPNDVKAGGRKLAGILVETLSDGRQVLGIGINTNNRSADAPAELKSKVATLLDLTGRRHDPTTFLAALLSQLERVLEQLAAQPDDIGDRVDRLCLQSGRVLELRFENRSVTGRCLGIARDGALLLETPSGRQAFYSGVVDG